MTALIGGCLDRADIGDDRARLEGRRDSLLRWPRRSKPGVQIITRSAFVRGHRWVFRDFVGKAELKNRVQRLIGASAGD
jgi:hypothetical protein